MDLKLQINALKITKSLNQSFKTQGKVDRIYAVENSIVIALSVATLKSRLKDLKLNLKNHKL